MEEKRKMSDKIRVMFTEEEVNNKIKELGAQISADMNGADLPEKTKICADVGQSDTDLSA